MTMIKSLAKKSGKSQHTFQECLFTPHYEDNMTENHTLPTKTAGGAKSKINGDDNECDRRKPVVAPFSV